MQAIQITSFLPDNVPYSALRPTVIPRPKPKHGEVLVRITHVSLQQVDLLFARGKHQNNNAKHGHVLPPFTLGLEFAGIVEELSITNAPSQGEALHIGDRVMGQCYGAFAEYICVRVEETSKVPPGVTSASAATLAGGLVSYAAVHTVAKLRAGETVLITGANGGLGIIACQIARAAGAQVIALVGSEKKAHFLRRGLDLDKVIAREQEPKWVEKVKGLTQGRGVDAIIDNIGLVEDGLRCLKFGGLIVLVGFAGREGVMEKVAMNKILLKGAQVIGYVSRMCPGSSIDPQLTYKRFGELSRQNPQILVDTWKGYDKLLRSGAVKALIDSRVYEGIREIPRALQDLADRKLLGKAVVSIGWKERAPRL